VILLPVTHLQPGTSTVLKQWRTECSECEPHSMPGYRMSVELAERLWLVYGDPGCYRRDGVAILGRGHSHHPMFALPKFPKRPQYSDWLRWFGPGERVKRDKTSSR